MSDNLALIETLGTLSEEQLELVSLIPCSAPKRDPNAIKLVETGIAEWHESTVLRSMIRPTDLGREAKALVKQVQHTGAEANLKPGDVFHYDASNPHLITPHTILMDVTVTWFDGENVFYRKGDSTQIDQTSLDRFLEATSTAHLKDKRR